MGAHPRTRPDRYVHATGYVFVYAPHHPDAQYKYIREHRLVMEQTLGRRLTKFENVHHINGDRQDNHPANLEVWAKVQPPGQRVVDLYAHAEWIMNTYGPNGQLTW